MIIKYEYGVCPFCNSDDVEIKECEEGADGIDQNCNKCGGSVCEADGLAWGSNSQPVNIQRV